MIQRAKFQNFKALRDVEVTFDSRLTVLVGPNGAGKTSVLQGIDWTMLLGAGIPLVELVNYRPESVTLQFTVEDFVSSEVRGQFLGGSGEAGLRMELREREPRYGRGLQNEDVLVQYYSEATRGDWVAVTTGDRPVFGATSFAQFDPKMLATPTHPTGGPPFLSPRGEGLASALASLALNQPEVFQKITSHLSSVVKGVKRIRFNRYESDKPEREPLQADNPQLIQLRTRKAITESLLFDFDTAKGVHSSEVSDGTLLILGLLTLVYCYPQSFVVLCDDIDHGLHPKAQMDLVHLLRQLLSDLPDLQIVATSHSPYILDRLEASEVRVMTLREDGSAVCAPLTSHPDFERWKEAMSPGEFWSTFYEDWLTRKPQPQPAS